MQCLLSGENAQDDNELSIMKYINRGKAGREKKWSGKGHRKKGREKGRKKERKKGRKEEGRRKEGGEGGWMDGWMDSPREREGRGRKDINTCRFLFWHGSKVVGVLFVSCLPATTEGGKGNGQIFPLF